MRLFTFASICAQSALFANAALAWEHTTTWRFSGDEMTGFALTEQQGEDPEAVEIWLDSDSGVITVMIEADNGLGDCPETLSYAQGNPHVTVVLTAHLNADTLNGVTLAQCSWR